MEIPHVPTSTETVTREWMSRVLADEFRTDSKNVLITDLQVCVGTQRTDGFLSRMQRIIVTAKQKRGDDDTEGDPDTQQTLHLIAKLFPPGEVHQKLVRHLRAFEREIHVYQCHLNLVMSSQDQVPKIRPPFPKIYFCETGLDASCIVMEDLKHSGFKLNDKMRGMDLAHALLCAQGEAILAATAFNAKQRVGVEQYMLDNAPLLLNPLTNHFGVMLDTQVYPGLISFAEGRNREDLVKRLQDYVVRVKSPYVRLMAGVERLGDLAVFSHGDCWNNNYMFRYELDADGNEIPVEVKVLDLQISR
ncbi:unnamed protein product [Notodromas monacha]|uniref:CHK kinase-like domain-containing protein n=1 Tax=Notodromas monacha TaxID=399045 RepID=A0A7R9BXR1_9CRUS|nr:unnamed protein product [Notodromas monacha]CAG0922184.1 unnamed protein product [Notodromas monacha]